MKLLLISDTTDARVCKTNGDEVDRILFWVRIDWIDLELNLKLEQKKINLSSVFDYKLESSSLNL